MLLNPGTVLGGRYEILEKIGSGGMAMVYCGKDRKLDRYVTVKVLREEYIEDEEFIARFQSEASAAARITHPNIVRVYDVGEDDGIQYIVMEYIHGDTLKTAIKKKAPFDSRSTINVAIQIASALSQAHKAHIVHRDIKPQNILVGTDGVIKVTDFGIARAARASTMTTTANAAGSVHYFSPEQARGGYVDEKSDIYSLGITMFEMITGVLPFDGNNSVAIALKHINEELPDIRQYNPKCTHSLEGIIRKATMKKSDERYANIELMLSDLLRARTELNTTTEEYIDETTIPPQMGIRMTRRMEAEKQTQQHTEEELEQTMVQSPLISQPEQDMEGQTKKVSPEDVEQIRMQRTVDRQTKKSATAEEDDVHTPLVSFERYEKKLKISKDDQYEREYMAAEEVHKSKRPQRQRRNPRKEENFDNDYDRKTERKVIVAAILTALVIIGIISFVGLRALGGLNGFGSGTKDIATPNFVGMTYEQAIQEAERMGLQIVKEGEDYNSYYDTNYVFWQDVESDTMVAKNTKIGVKVSIGLTQKDMIDVVGKSEKDAKEAIIELVGTSPTVVYEYDDDVKAGYVISQTPLENASIDANSKITLTVSKGAENQDVAVPNVQGSSEQSAIQSLQAVGLVVGDVSHIDSETVAKGLVITQTLSPNQEVPTGSVINLVVSNGAPQKEEEPEQPETEQPETEQPENNETQTNTDDNNSQTPTEPTTPEEQPSTTGTKYFTIQAPEGAGDTVHVQVIKADETGTTILIDDMKNLSDFPFSIAVEGTGSGTVTGYTDGVLQLQESVNFGE